MNPSFDRKQHWENIYQTKQLEEVSWYQSKPETSLNFIRQFELPLTARIIDVGGGDSLLVDYLLDMGYRDVTVLDISAEALERAKQRLGERARMVKWIEADVASFRPDEQYDFWHDRATFHFLTDEPDIESYVNTVRNYVKPEGNVVIGTFSENGPEKCSGIWIRKYSEEQMVERFNKYFEKVKCIHADHVTPSGKVQNFIFCSFRKLKAK